MPRLRRKANGERSETRAASRHDDPELVRARLEIERAEAELASAKQEYKPDFMIQGGYLVMPNQTDALLARVGVTWPRAPWSHGKVDAHVAEKTAAVDAAKARAAYREVFELWKDADREIPVLQQARLEYQSLK